MRHRFLYVEFTTQFIAVVCHRRVVIDIDVEATTPLGALLVFVVNVDIEVALTLAGFLGDRLACGRCAASTPRESLSKLSGKLVVIPVLGVEFCLNVALPRPTRRRVA